MVGGPCGDTGLTGRKIIVDTYGGAAAHGGGCFSGKDPTKVDRSAAYMARHVAKNIVAAGLARRCQIELAYAIGVAHPVSVLVDTQGTGVLPDEQLSEIVNRTFDLRPASIISYLDLRRPIYEQIKDGLRRMVVSGALAPDEKLPSVRALATQLSINPNTIQRSYNELEAEGLIYSVPGKGSFVSPDRSADLRRRLELTEKFREIAAELRYLGVGQEELLALVKEVADR